MRVPKEELPDVEAIRKLAILNLPPHYRLKDVRCEYGSGGVPTIPEDFEVVIEYEDRLDQKLQDTMEAIAAHRDWQDPLIAAIRAEWSPHALRIAISQTCG